MVKSWRAFNASGAYLPEYVCTTAHDVDKKKSATHGRSFEQLHIDNVCHHGHAMSPRSRVGRAVLLAFALYSTTAARRGWPFQSARILFVVAESPRTAVFFSARTNPARAHAASP